MSDNTLQFEVIVTIHGNLEFLFRNRPDVFVAGDHLIYVDPTNPAARMAPDVYVVFGRPKEHRGSYKLWREEGIFPQVIFEVWSPSNTPAEMAAKRSFYERHGAQEFYLLDPDPPASFEGWVRQGDRFVEVQRMNGHVSPLLGVRFEEVEGRAVMYHPDGQRFLSSLERAEQEARERATAEAERQRAEAERQRARVAEERAEQEKQRAETERQQAEAERRRAGSAEERAARLAARLRELGIDPDAG